ncbi:MAG: Proline--tRNA ligase, partial [candidate division WS6 bacterium 36_33]
MKKGITPREESYSKWYLDIVEQAELAENSPVRG